MMDAESMLLGLLFSSIGMGYFMYGKKQKLPAPLVCGLILMLYPYFVVSHILLISIGILFSITPVLFKIGYLTKRNVPS